MSEPLRSLLDSQGVAILDGGLATELEARGHDLGDDLWSARLLVDEPDSVRRLHLDYLEAGADCIVSASYQASIPGFTRRGLGEDEAVRLLRLSVELARAARDEFWAVAGNRAGRHRPLVAASVGPYGAFLADGSEYRGDYDLDASGLACFHRRRLAILAGSGADLLACETLPSAIEARVLVELLAEIPGCPAWLSFSCRDGERIRDGTPLATIAAEVAASPRAIAVGVNCTAPAHLARLIPAVRRGTAKPIVVYPNSGEHYDAATGRWLPGDCAPRLADGAAEWVALGARLVGGCCRTGPGEIRELRQRLLAAS
jgi:homocysteine S-methyltransferase